MREYLICWRNIITGNQGFGYWLMDNETAEGFVERMNEKHPLFYHWIDETNNRHRSPNPLSLEDRI